MSRTLNTHAERVFVSIGSNVRPEIHLPEAVRRLASIGRLRGVSRVYRSTAVGPVGPVAQPDYLNAAGCLDTALSPQTVRRRLRDLEHDLGRHRGLDKFAPRTVDLDLCLYGDLVLCSGELTLPHPDVILRPYVAVPIAELAPDLCHPLTGERLADIARRLGGQASLTLRPDVDF
ncbi:MAG: 2-amino-4-hydroxy-6-hydroxymethyldihydropteridine diphosphokinase [Phycisphaerae bacterium]